jgi:hypothetical protein
VGRDQLEALAALADDVDRPAGAAVTGDHVAQPLLHAIREGVHGGMLIPAGRPRKLGA